MGLETVKEEIIRNAKEQASALIAQAKKESNRIAKETENKIEEINEKIETESKKIIENIKRQELSSCELENKKMLLEAKKHLIESVFTEAGKKLESLDDKKREPYMKKLLEKTKKDIKIDFVYCNKKDSKFIKGFDLQAIEMSGGLIAENKERTILVDYSFETLLSSIKETKLENINKILF